MARADSSGSTSGAPAFATRASAGTHAGMKRKQPSDTPTGGGGISNSSAPGFDSPPAGGFGSPSFFGDEFSALKVCSRYKLKRIIGSGSYRATDMPRCPAAVAAAMPAGVDP